MSYLVKNCVCYLRHGRRLFQGIRFVERLLLFGGQAAFDLFDILCSRQIFRTDATFQQDAANRFIIGDVFNGNSLLTANPVFTGVVDWAW